MKHDTPAKKSVKGSSKSDHTVMRMGQISWSFINRLLILVFLLGLIGGAALFYYNAVHDYSINKGFTPIELNFNIVYRYHYFPNTYYPFCHMRH